MKRWGKVSILAALVGIAGAASALAQSTQSTDGVIQPGEYSIDRIDGPSHIYASFDDGKIHLAIVGETKGWVAIGVDSKRMNGAKIFMGYVDGNGESFTTQAGVRHSHHDSSEFEALAHAVAQTGNRTTMEIELDRSAFLGPGQSALNIIYAVGNNDSFREYHSFHGTTTLAVQ